ncbi:hypothetical protein VTI28DRAFT_9264 [Corynascus sepedonium]
MLPSLNGAPDRQRKTSHSRTSQGHGRNARGTVGHQLVVPRDANPKEAHLNADHVVQNQCPQNWLVHTAGYPASGLIAKLLRTVPASEGRPLFPHCVSSSFVLPPALCCCCSESVWVQPPAHGTRVTPLRTIVTLFFERYRAETVCLLFNLRANSLSRSRLRTISRTPVLHDRKRSDLPTALPPSRIKVLAT